MYSLGLSSGGGSPMTKRSDSALILPLSRGTIPTRRSHTPVATRDPDDDYLVALMLEAGADPLISGDADLAQVGGFILLTPRQALDSINSEAGS